MTKLKKIADSKYEVTMDGKAVGTAFKNYKGMYQIELPNGRTIEAVNQSVLKRMVTKYA